MLGFPKAHLKTLPQKLHFPFLLSKCTAHLFQPRNAVEQVGTAPAEEVIGRTVIEKAETVTDRSSPQEGSD